MKVFGHPMSTCTRKVLMTLAETGTPHEMVMVDLAKGEHKAAEHVARQPFGQLPAIEDDGFGMYESRAIIRYLDDKAGHKLTPKGAREKAVMEQWISVETSDFTPHAMTFIYEHIFKRPQGDEKLAAAGKQLDVALKVMDTELGKNTFLGSSTMTLADIGYMPYVEYLMATPAKAHLEKFPNVMAWWQRVSERPTWKKVSGKG
ncbi:glutathione S-transferase family protein [bacterium]|nr:MAG: glutathione S-transferase family protein [bacterium]